MWGDAETFAANLGAESLRVDCTDLDGERFALRRGFTKGATSVESERLLNGTNSPPVPGLGDDRLASLHTLGPSWHEPFFEAAARLAGPDAMLSRDMFGQRVLCDESLQVVAMRRESVVGVCCVERIPATRSWFHIFTGVDIAFRNRGLAGAMKACVIRLATAAGEQRLIAYNGETSATLGVNERLGFVRIGKRASYSR